ncbi:MAG: recombination mediator RecR [Oscillospiraceae bacterium]|jgi:recombination protein RecR|nr:recombination mediator RecR [Oscillospiraceae bacterium]
MAEYTPLPLILAAEQFARLPGIGMKTAQRLAYHILTMPSGEVEHFAGTLVSARESVRCCSVCQNFTEKETCVLCEDGADGKRNGTIICVVEAPRDVTAIERTGGFDGSYHVLHGLLSPMDGTGPEHIRMKELMARLSGDVGEVIMATNPTVEGEATASYICRLIKPMGIKVSRLAYGLPVGASLEFADDVTLVRAMENRNLI